MREQDLEEKDRRFLTEEVEEAEVSKQYGQVFNRQAEQQEHERNLPLQFLNHQNSHFLSAILYQQVTTTQRWQVHYQKIVIEWAVVVAQEQDPREAEDRK